MEEKQNYYRSRKQQFNNKNCACELGRILLRADKTYENNNVIRSELRRLVRPDWISDWTSLNNSSKHQLQCNDLADKL